VTAQHSKEKVTVLYDDGEKEDVTLAKERFEWLFLTAATKEKDAKKRRKGA
jgi:hypothetical protein